MNKTIENNITDYISYFRRQLKLVGDYGSNTQDGELHSRILHITILDAISRVVFTKETNRDRIVKFVGDFCDWPESNRVSLSHLYKLVINKKENEYSPLRNFVIDSMSRWIPAEKILLTRDPIISEVEQLWPQANGKLLGIDGVCINWLQHSQLLYTYRNNLIHEFKIPGRHVELWDEDQPYYTSLIEYKNDNFRDVKQSWELQYTAKFFNRLCESGLSNLYIYLTKNAIDPFTTIDWGNYWIRELNL
jgi:hypothetical protein